MKGMKVCGVGLLALAASVSAPSFAEGLNYTFIEGGYVDTDLDDIDVDGDGLGVRGSFDLGSNIFLHAAYVTQDFDRGVDLDQYQVGIGGYLSLGDQFDLVGKLSYVDAEVDTPFGDFDDDGYGLSVGLRGRVTPDLELEGAIEYIDLDDSGDDTALVLDGRYYFTENFAVGAGASFSDDATTWTVGARFEF